MEYNINTNNRPFRAILAGTKTVEGRTPTALDRTPYHKLKAGDLINLINNLSGESIKVKISFIHHYSNVKKMLEKEGVQNVLSSNPKTIKHGIESYNSIEGYRDGIKKNGIYALGVIKP